MGQSDLTTKFDLIFDQTIKYSGGSNTEHVWISDGRACLVHGPDHWITKFQNSRSSLGHFENYVKRPSLDRPF